jgi:hypothetical protein
MADRSVVRLAALALVLVAAGCGGDDLSVDDAPARLGPVVDVVADALVADLGATDVPPAAGSLAPGEDDTCYYRSQTYTFPDLLGVDTPLEEVRDVVARALEDQDGWELLDDEDIPGGFVGLDAEGPGGARLELRTRTETELRIVAQLDGPCEREELPLP